MSDFLEVKGLKKSYGKSLILKGIDFSLKKGEVLSVIGSSGGGKTTLLRCLNFLTIADEGQILVDGKTIFDGKTAGSMSDEEMRACRLHFGLVFQNFNLFPQYTALENVMLAQKLLKTADEATILKQSKALLDEMGLSNKMDLYPCQMSGGQQQRVAIARALAMNPDILTFDEPTSALDPEITGEVLNVIRKLSSDLHTTMIIVTHEMSFARDISAKTIFLADGLIEEMGPSKQLFDHPKSERLKTFLSSVHS